MSHEAHRTELHMNRRIALGSVGAAAAALGLGAVTPAAAQEATPGAMATHPIVGTWLLMNASVPPSPTTTVFHADGSVMSISAVNYPDTARGVVFASDLVGTWEPISDFGVHITGISIESDANAVYSGTATLDAYPVVSADGQTWTDDGTQVKLTIRDTANAVVTVIGGGGDQPPITPPVKATRMLPRPLVFPPIPEMPGQFPGAEDATPTP